jgi:hypothetical protein
MEPKARVQKWIIAPGILCLVLGLGVLVKARIADLHHSLIPWRSASIAPLQAYGYGALWVAFGLVICIMWIIERRAK